MYFFSLYGASSVGAFVLLRCVGIFVSATLPVLIIMVPKFTVIQYKNITGKNLWANSRSKGGNHSSSGGGISEKAAGLLLKNTYDMKSLPACQVIPSNRESEFDTPSNDDTSRARTLDHPEVVACLVDKLSRLEETHLESARIRYA